MSLSKMHVRFIQSQKNFIVDQQKTPISHLYIKDNTSFYFFNANANIIHEEVIIDFNEETPALKSLHLKLAVKKLSPESEEYEDALLFFNHSNAPTQLLYLTVVSQEQVS